MDKDEVIELGWHVTLWAVVVAFVVFLSILFTTDHRVRRYYIGTPLEGMQVGQTCVAADLPWETDDRVFCSQDPQKTLEFMERANQQLKGTK